MSSMMEWLLILAVGYNFLSTWIISGILDRMERTIDSMNAEMERMRRNP